MRNKNLKAAARLIPAFGRELDSVIQAIDTLKKDSDTSLGQPGRTLPPSTVRDRLLELKALLNQDDASAGKRVLQLAGNFSGQDTDALFTRLSEQTAAFEYDAAKKTLHSLFQKWNNTHGGASHDDDKENCSGC